MQAHFGKQTGKGHGYMDPRQIAQSRFAYPKKWKLDGKELAGGKTVEEKEEIRTKRLKEEAIKLAAYIAVTFKNLEKNQSIWLPYHFE